MRHLLTLLAVLGATATVAQDLTHASTIALRSDHGLYLSAQDDGRLVADRQDAGEWETFLIRRVPVNPGGTMHYGQHLNLRSSHRRWVAGEENGGAKADREAAGPWEDWTIHNAGDLSSTTAIACGDRVALKSSHGTYLVAEEGGGVKADRGAVGAWESWTLQCQSVAPKPIQSLSDLGQNEAFFLRDLTSGGFVRIDGDRLVNDSAIAYDQATPLAMGKIYHPKSTNIGNEVEIQSWAQEDSYRSFALRTADGGDINLVAESGGSRMYVAYDIEPYYIGSMYLAREEAPGRFFVWVFKTDFDAYVYRMSCGRYDGDGCGALKVSRRGEARSILYREMDRAQHFEFYPAANVQVAVVDAPTTTTTGQPIGQGAGLPRMTDEKTFDGATSLEFGTHRLPRVLDVLMEVRVDDSSQWDHVLEVGVAEHVWSAPLRLEVGNEGQWYIAVGDGSSYVEAEFNSGWRYGQWQTIRFLYDSDTGTGTMSHYVEGTMHQPGGWPVIGTITGGPDISAVEGTAILGGSAAAADRFFHGAMRNVSVNESH